MNFKILEPISKTEVIASGRGIKELKRLQKNYGIAYWRKLKGFAKIKLDSGDIVKAEIHWYEAHGIGKREFRIKKILK
ncbi:MAG: hypothetical protein HQM15_09525 [Deltaproteobacteria bacterium]|nr:hypothetical protein [Deltaproteobacteria bacterium]